LEELEHAKRQSRKCHGVVDPECEIKTKKTKEKMRGEKSLSNGGQWNRTTIIASIRLQVKEPGLETNDGNTLLRKFPG
jgi:hypothetical protein